MVTYKGDAKEGGIPKTIERESQPRSVRIRADDLKKFGYTAGCPGCAWHTDRIGPHRGHSSECRKRIEEAMAKTEEGRKRMEVTKARKDKHEEQH